MKFIPKQVTRAVAKKVITAKKNSPHIYFAAGVVGVVGSTFLACRATLKLEETLEDITDEIRDVKATDNNRLAADGDADYYKDMAYVYVKSATKIGRLYGPSVVVGSLSIAALTGSHIQLTRRNTALTATLAALSKSFDDYRVRVAAEVGDDKERDIYRAMSEEEYEEDGRKLVRKVTDPNGWSIYARMFAEDNANFVKNAEYNRIFIQAQQNYFNDRLQVYGHVFLNEVYDALGFDRTTAGQLVGWTLDGKGDGYVDFGLYEAASAGFTNGYEPRVVLDFNVDGMIYESF